MNKGRTNAVVLDDSQECQGQLKEKTATRRVREIAWTEEAGKNLEAVQFCRADGLVICTTLSYCKKKKRLGTESKGRNKGKNTLKVRLKIPGFDDISKLSNTKCVCKKQTSN